MQAVSVKEILDITNGELICGNPSAEIKEFSLDSRTLVQGDVFIAIKGARFDGHHFVKDAIKKGALGIIVEETFSLPSNLPSIVIKVRDTINLLGDIARICRNRFKGSLIAVTGTVGKTTTKEFIATVLEGKFCLHKNQGTLNNHIGVPVTLWGLEPKHEVCVMELGMSNRGEIRYLADISKPDVGVITNIGPAHLERLGNIENIIEAKSELLESMKENGLVILNIDNTYFPNLRARARCRLITIGKHHNADFQAVDISVDENGYVSFNVIAKPFNDILEIKLPVLGTHNIYPALTSIAIGYGLGMEPGEIINCFMKIKLPKMRLELKDIAGIKIIDDCYNANPISMASALETFSMLKVKGKRIFVCGDMLELGDDSSMYHKELGRKVVEYGVNRLITVGDFSGIVSGTAIECGMQPEFVKHCKDNIGVIEILGEWLEPGDVVLVKGSRARHMEDVTKGIEEYYKTLEKLIV